MDLSISHGQAQRLLKQRNMLAITATGLFALSVVLTLTAAQRDREVVLQPVLAKPLTLSSSHIDKDYLELVTRDAALLTLAVGRLVLDPYSATLYSSSPRVFSEIEEKVRGGLALPDAIERVAFPDFVPPEPGAPDFAEGELAEAAE